MRHLALAVVLACVVSGTAWAGEIPSSDWVPPPPPPGSSSVATHGEIPTSDATAPGEIPSGGAPAPQASGTLLTIILSLLSIGR